MSQLVVLEGDHDRSSQKLVWYSGSHMVVRTDTRKQFHQLRFVNWPLLWWLRITSFKFIVIQNGMIE